MSNWRTKEISPAWTRPRNVMVRAPSGLVILNAIRVPSILPSAIVVGVSGDTFCRTEPVSAVPSDLNSNVQGPPATAAATHRPSGLFVGFTGAAGAAPRAPRVPLPPAFGGA